MDWIKSSTIDADPSGKCHVGQLIPIDPKNEIKKERGNPESKEGEKNWWRRKGANVLGGKCDHKADPIPASWSSLLAYP